MLRGLARWQNKMSIGQPRKVHKRRRLFGEPKKKEESRKWKLERQELHDSEKLQSEVIQRAGWVRVKLGSCCSLLLHEGTVVSVMGVHTEVTKKTHTVNKSEVYSHNWDLFFCFPFWRLMARQGCGRVCLVEGGEQKGQETQGHRKTQREGCLTGRSTDH